MDHHLLLIIHILAATVWVGGHLYLVVCILPGVLRSRNPEKLLGFERSFEPLGITALVLLVLSGFWMMFQFGIRIEDVFSFATPIERVTSTKILLLLTTVAFALSAQFRVIPSLKKSPKKLVQMGVYAICVTAMAIAMLVLGTFVRYGGI